MLDIEDHKQSPEPDVLADRHTQLDDFGVAEFCAQFAEKNVVNGLMVQRHLFRKLHGQALSVAEKWTGSIFSNGGNFLFRQARIHRRWMSAFLSEAALIELCNLMSHQFFQGNLGLAPI
jgi:hypothetical protein